MKPQCLITTALVLMVGSAVLAHNPAGPTRSAAPDLQENLDVYVGRLKHGSVDERREAVLALGRIAERAKAAVPALVKALKHESASTRMYAAEVLWKIRKDPAAVAAMMEDLKDKDWRVRCDAAHYLGRFGVAAKAAVPALAEACNDPVTFVRISADLALWQIDKHPDAIPALIATLKDPDSSGHRSSAADALGHIGAEAKAAVPALVEALKDYPWTAAENSGFHIPAALALWQIDKHPGAVPALIACLKEQEGERRMAAAMALGRIGVDAKAAVPALAEALKDEKDFVRKSAAEALGGMGVKAKGAVPALIEAAKEQTGFARVAAAEALWRINKHPAAVPALVECLKDSTDQADTYAHMALRRIGAEARAAVPALTEALKDGNVHVRVEAAITLWKINKDPALVAVLIQTLKDMKVFGPMRIAAAVASMDRDPSAVPILLQALDVNGENCYARVEVARVLWQINKHPAAVDALLKALKDAGGPVDRRADAAEALWQINRHPAAVPVLVDTLSIDALGQVGTEGTAAVAALVEALHAEDEGVRASAAQSLMKIDPK